MHDQEDAMRILPLAAECDRLLTRFIASTESSASMQTSQSPPNPLGKLAKDWQDRFNAWSSYLGVFAEDRISLDRRLVYHADIRGMIIKLLEIMRCNLQTVIATSREDGQGRSVGGSSSDEGPLLRVQEEKKFVEGSIDRLHRLGVTIRRSSVASLRARVDAFADKSKSSIEDLCSKAIKRMYPLAPESLQSHLIQSILHRYFTLLYRQQRQKQMSERRSLDRDIYVDEAVEEDKVVNRIAAPSAIAGPTAAPDKAMTNSTNDSRSGTKPSTKPSTLETQEFHRRNRILENPAPAKDSATSIASSAPTCGLSYPSPPRWDQLSEYVSCSWCFEPLSASRCKDARHQTTAWWRRHVDRDLTPYVCLAENCADPPPTFDRRSMWTIHMVQNHSASWAQQIHREPRWTCKIGHSPPIDFASQDDLALHMHEAHGELFNPRQIASIVRRGSGRSTRREGTCPFRCSYDATKDAAVEISSPECTTTGSIPFVGTSRDSQKRPIANKHRQTKRPRVRFADQNLKQEDTDSSNVSTEEEGENGLRDIVEKPLERALSQHIATHLLSLSFLTLRFKDLRSHYSEALDDDDSVIYPDSDSSNASNVTRDDSDLDAISLNFQDSGPLTNDALDQTDPIVPGVSDVLETMPQSSHRDADNTFDANEPRGPEVIDIKESMSGESHTSRADLFDIEGKSQALGDRADDADRRLLGLYPDYAFTHVPHENPDNDALARFPSSESSLRRESSHLDETYASSRPSLDARSTASQTHLMAYVGSWDRGLGDPKFEDSL